MNELKGGEGELRMTIEIKRKASGKVETVELSGPISAEAATELGTGLASVDDSTPLVIERAILGAVEGGDFRPEAMETSDGSNT